jgi:hypothetical protein
METQEYLANVKNKRATGHTFSIKKTANKYPQKLRVTSGMAKSSVGISDLAFPAKVKMELDFQNLLGLHVLSYTQLYPPLPLSFWAHIRGRYWSAKIDDISL